MIPYRGKDTQSIYFRNKEIAYAFKGEQLIYKLDKFDLCNVILYDNTLNKLVQASEFEHLSPERYEPIGIVVIPTSHDVYNTGECGIVSLLRGSTTSPDTGTTENESVYWGGYGTDYSELHNFTKVPQYGTLDLDEPKEQLDGESGWGYVPVMRERTDTKCVCPHDTQASYYASVSSNYSYCPSPYLNDNSRNPDYYSTQSPSSEDNALSDFDGKGNTEVLISGATSQSNWKTADSITNNYDSGYQPAACVCWRYHTLGTNQGDWYLPACGELAYIIPRFDKINEVITNLQSWSGKTFCPIISEQVWTSTEVGSYNVRYIRFITGFVNYNYGSRDFVVRPFLRGKFEKIN